MTKVTFDVCQNDRHVASLYLEYSGQESPTSLSFGVVDLKFLTSSEKIVKEFLFYISTVPTFGAKKCLNINLLVPGLKKETCSFDGIKAALDLFPSDWSYRVDRKLVEQEIPWKQGDPWIL